MLALFSAWMVKLKVPIVVGVPESTPPVERDRPGGSMPVYDHITLVGLAGPCPKLWFMAVPMINWAGGGLVIAGAMFGSQLAVSDTDSLTIGNVVILFAGSANITPAVLVDHPSNLCPGLAPAFMVTTPGYGARLGLAEYPVGLPPPLWFIVTKKGDKGTGVMYPVVGAATPCVPSPVMYSGSSSP